MTAERFRREFEQRLLSAGEQNLLTIALFPAFDRPVRLTGNEVRERARKLAARFCSSDEQEVVLLLLPHSVELFLLQIGMVLQGRYPAVLPWPTNRMDRYKYQRNLVHQLRHLAAGRLITTHSLGTNLSGTVPFPVIACELESIDEGQQRFPSDVLLELSGTEEIVIVPPGTDRDCLFFQFSGGTTGSQKSVPITARMLAGQLDRLAEALGFTSKDAVASWLPLYHDMGLIACLWLPLWIGAPSIHMGASDWLLGPELLFRYLEEYKATFCWLPNFAFSYLTKRRAEMGRVYSLQHVRAFINCSEPLRRASMESFAEVFADFGIRPAALQGSYAMAENVFAVTQTPMGERLNTAPRERVSGSFLGSAFSLKDDVFVSSGKFLRDTQVRIVQGDGSACHNGVPGEIQISSPSLFDGYCTKDGRSRSAFTDDGWYATGDYGFMFGENLYVIGRLKDMVIVGGQNIFPEDVEYIVNTLPHVYPGRVVAFGMPDEQYGTETLAIVAELHGTFSPEAAESLEAEIRKSVLAVIGIAPRCVAAVPERWIVKSTAGKISRHETKERFMQHLSGVAEQDRMQAVQRP